MPPSTESSIDLKLVVGIIALLCAFSALAIAFRAYRRNFGRRVRISMRRYDEGTLDGTYQDIGYKVKVENTGLPLRGVYVILEVREPNTAAAITGTLGLRMTAVSVPDRLDRGETAMFRLSESHMRSPQFLTTAAARHQVNLMRELKDNEVAISVYASGDELIGRVIEKKGRAVWKRVQNRQQLE